jgi:thymidylate kinase
MDERRENESAGSRLIIVVDGPNFAGKTTFVGRILESLPSRGRASRVLNFPRANSYWGAQARKAFADPNQCEEVRAELVAQDFAEELTAVSKTQTDEVVIWDRFYLSTCSCQGFAGWRKLLHHQLFEYPVQPDYYVLLDVDYTEALRRAKKKREEEGVAWDQRIEDIELASEEAWDAAREKFALYAQLVKEQLPNTVFLKIDHNDVLTPL